jgi:hypothetical protein
MKLKRKFIMVILWMEKLFVEFFLPEIQYPDKIAAEFF